MLGPSLRMKKKMRVPPPPWGVNVQSKSKRTLRILSRLSCQLFFLFCNERDWSNLQLDMHEMYKT